MPPSLKGLYDEESYSKLREYTAANTRLDMLSSAFDLAVLAIFWFGGGFEYLDRVVRSFQWGPVVSGLVYLGALACGRMILSMPFEIFSTFGIEQRFGFNKTTPRMYVTDSIKGVVLSIVLGGPILAAILGLLEHGGPRAWLYCWAVVAGFLLVMVYVAPAVILPLFNKFTPLEEGDLRKAIIDYGKANRFPIADISVMDGSRRSTKANAFFTGFGATKRIVLFDTLINNHTKDELVAVLAHEVGHFKHRHIIQHLVLTILNVGLLLFLASILVHQPALHQAFGVRTVSVYCGLALFLIIYTPLSRLTSILIGFQTRAHEFDADRFAVNTTGHAAAMADALRKLVKSNLSHPAPHPLSVILYDSHPPAVARIAAIQALAH